MTLDRPWAQKEPGGNFGVRQMSTEQASEFPVAAELVYSPANRSPQASPGYLELAVCPGRSPGHSRSPPRSGRHDPKPRALRRRRDRRSAEWQRGAATIRPCECPALVRGSPRGLAMVRGTPNARSAARCPGQRPSPSSRRRPQPPPAARRPPASAPILARMLATRVSADAIHRASWCLHACASEAWYRSSASGRSPAKCATAPHAMRGQQANGWCCRIRGRSVVVPPRGHRGNAPQTHITLVLRDDARQNSAYGCVPVWPMVHPGFRERCEGFGDIGIGQSAPPTSRDTVAAWEAARATRAASHVAR